MIKPRASDTPLRDARLRGWSTITRGDGLVLAKRTRTGRSSQQDRPAAIQNQQGDADAAAMLSFEVARNPISARSPASWKRTASKRVRNDSVPSIGPVLTFRTTRAHDRAVQGVELSRQAFAAPGVGPLKLGNAWWWRTGEDAEFYSKVLGFRSRIGSRFLRVIALQFRIINRKFHSRHDSKCITWPSSEGLQSILQNSCDRSDKGRSIIWAAAARAGSTSPPIRNPDDQVIEFFCELRKMVDEELAISNPAWHQDTPAAPKTGKPARPALGTAADPEFIGRRDAVARSGAT